MNQVWMLLLALTLALPAHTQEEPAEEAPAAEPAPEETPAEPTAIETTPTEAAAAEESLDTVPVEEEAPAEEAGDPLRLYGGVDYASTTLSSSNLNGFPARDYDSGMYRLRLGARLVDPVSAEVHFGFDNSDEGAGQVATENYYGLFVAPTARLFDTVELAFPIGYAQTSVERSGAGAAREDLGSLAYGINAELPLRTLGVGWPDLRFGGGWMIQYQKSDARMYGWNAGLRYDFSTSGFGFGNPFAGLDLWPFGDDEDGTAEESVE